MLGFLSCSLAFCLSQMNVFLRLKGYCILLKHLVRNGIPVKPSAVHISIRNSVLDSKGKNEG